MKALKLTFIAIALAATMPAHADVELDFERPAFEVKPVDVPAPKSAIFLVAGVALIAFGRKLNKAGE